MISVTPRARSREDRAGDPLDGLVNLFDLGIVLSVAFLLAALSSLHLGRRSRATACTQHPKHDPDPARPDGRAAAEARPADDRARAARSASSTDWPTGSSSTSRTRPTSEEALSGVHLGRAPQRRSR